MARKFQARLDQFERPAVRDPLNRSQKLLKDVYAGRRQRAEPPAVEGRLDVAFRKVPERMHHFFEAQADNIVHGAHAADRIHKTQYRQHGHSGTPRWFLGKLYVHAHDALTNTKAQISFLIVVPTLWPKIGAEFCSRHGVVREPSRSVIEWRRGVAAERWSERKLLRRPTTSQGRFSGRVHA